MKTVQLSPHVPTCDAGRWAVAWCFMGKHLRGRMNAPRRAGDCIWLVLVCMDSTCSAETAVRIDGIEAHRAIPYGKRRRT